MNKKENLSQVKILNKYPAVSKDFEIMRATRCSEITVELLKSDTDFQKLTQQRTSTSQTVLDALIEHGKEGLFESYSDAVYAEEVYESNEIYKEAFIDAMEMMERLGLLDNDDV